MKLRLQQFSGIAPKVSRQLLPDNMGVVARNCRLLSGELRGLHNVGLLNQFNSPTKYAVRIPNDPEPVWVGWAEDDIDFVRGPLVNDAYDRYYWTGEDAYLSVNTLARLQSGDPSYKAGTPPPATPCSVTPANDGTSGIIETRAYVYTFVNEFGEESAPSPPTVASGDSDATWDLALLQLTPTDAAGRIPVVKRRIYRTVTGDSSALYYFVADVNDITTTVYADTTPSTDVVQNTVCDTFDWDQPPDNLNGLISHPGGFLAGFYGNEIFLSEPYRPYAWPVPYILSIEYDVVGLAIYNNMLMVMTTSNPYYFAGTHPTNLSPTQSQSVEPCLAKRGIIATLQGVLYPSPNGLVLFNQAGATVVTNSILSPDEWTEQYSPSTLKAAQRGLQYLAFKDVNNGFEYSPAEPLGQFSTLDRFTNVDNIITDRYTGDIHLVSDNNVYLWDDVAKDPVYYTWKSKEFDVPRPLNFGAAIVKLEEYAADAEEPIVGAEEKEAWNTTRMAHPLHPIGFTPVGAPRTEDLLPLDYPPNFYDETLGGDRTKYPVGGSPLFITDPSFDPVGDVAYLKVYGDRELRCSLVIRHNKMMRLPSGYKAHYWQFEIVSNVNVYSLAVAETGKELMEV